MKIATWNINSVRLRINLAKRFLREEAPDVLCLQEIKCRDDQFPAKALRLAGYEHQAVSGQVGYHGVAIVSRLPLEDVDKRGFCGKNDCRHVAATLPGGVRLHNFYVPAGGDEPDPAVNEKFDHKLSFIKGMAEWFSGMGAPKEAKAVLVGDLNVAPREHDVWSHKQLLKVVSHTPVEVDHLAGALAAYEWIDVAREIIPDEEKVYTWWSYRAQNWKKSNRGRRLDHIWVTPALREAAIKGGRGGFAIHQRCRSWKRTSDHVPVTLKLAL